MTISRKTYIAVALSAMVPALLGAQGIQFNGGVPNTGGGLGSVLTVLTLNNTNNISAGCVRPVAVTGDLATCGYNESLVNSVQNTSTTRTVLELGGAVGTLGTDLRIFANFTEPQNPADVGARINSVRLDLYNALGISVFNTSFAGPQILPTTEPGLGNGAFGFSLNVLGAPAFQTALNALLLVPGNTTTSVRLGLGASLGDVQGGLESFSLARINVTPNLVPEPSTYALMAAGLAALGFVARRRRQS